MPLLVNANAVLVQQITKDFNHVSSLSSCYQTAIGQQSRCLRDKMVLFVNADPALARQIAVKDFNKFHDRFIQLDKSLKTGKRAEADKSSMAAAR